jgi:hypothetical protein
MAGGYGQSGNKGVNLDGFSVQDDNTFNSREPSDEELLLRKEILEELLRSANDKAKKV